MKLKHLWTALALALALGIGLAASRANATAVRLETASLSLAQGSFFDVRIVADIDLADEIIGFGFDLAASPGLALRGFTAGPGFADDALLASVSDADGIRGASGGSLLTGPAVSGLNILLGVLRLEATLTGMASVGLGADDLSFNFSEGLITLAALSSNLLPQITPLTLDITRGATGNVPEPGSLACVGVALLALTWAGRRRPR